MKIIIGIVLIFLVSPALAQQQSPLDQALSSKLLAEINSGLQCSAATIDLQKQLAAVTKERDELKAKNEPAKSDPGH